MNNKKLAVLHQLSQEAEPISLLELLKKLGDNYSERSVRRWLTEMVQEDLVERFRHKRGTKYQVINSTVKTIRFFDEIRVRYRQQRRALVREIILNKWTGSTVEKYLSTQALNLVREKERARRYERNGSKPGNYLRYYT